MKQFLSSYSLTALTLLLLCATACGKEDLFPEPTGPEPINFALYSKDVQLIHSEAADSTLFIATFTEAGATAGTRLDDRVLVVFGNYLIPYSEELGAYAGILPGYLADGEFIYVDTMREESESAVLDFPSVWLSTSLDFMYQTRDSSVSWSGQDFLAGEVISYVVSSVDTSVAAVEFTYRGEAQQLIPVNGTRLRTLPVGAGVANMTRFREGTIAGDVSGTTRLRTLYVTQPRPVEIIE